MKDKILVSTSLLTMPGFKWGHPWEHATRKIYFFCASQKLPRYLMSYNYPCGLPAENAIFSRKMTYSLPWFSAPHVSGIPEKSPSVFLQFYCPLNFQLLPEISLLSSTLTDFYVVTSTLAMVFLLLTVMKISDPSTQVLIDKGYC